MEIEGNIYCCENKCNMRRYWHIVGSSNGRTLVFGTSDRGSSPCPAANENDPWGLFRLLSETSKLLGSCQGLEKSEYVLFTVRMREQNNERRGRGIVTERSESYAVTESLSEAKTDVGRVPVLFPVRRVPRPKLHHTLC